MRLAELTRTLGKLSERKSDTAPALKLLSFDSLPGFAKTSVSPGVGFLVVCGGTGVGKTAILELIWCAVRSSYDPPARNLERLGSASFGIDIASPEGGYKFQGTVKKNPNASDGFPAGARFVGLEMRTADIQTALKQYEYDVLKEGAGDQELDKDMLALLSMICGKRYLAAKVFECEIEGGFIPVFEILTDGVGYDSRSMATGELSIFFIAWSLWTANPFSILLIEEPEAYFPPQSHVGIMGLIAKFTLKLKLCSIITTHSPTVAAEVPEKSLVSVRRVGQLSTLPQTVESRNKVLARLGLQPKKMVVLFVEDVLARDVLEELLSFYEFNIVCRYDVVVCEQGCGDIKNKLQHAPLGLQYISFIGVLDGDMKKQAANWKLPHPFVFLPFENEMEVEFLHVAKKNIGRFAKRIERDVPRIEDAFAAVEGKNLHDQYLDMSRLLGLPRDGFAALLLRFWVKEAGKRIAVKRFVQSLSKALDLTLPMRD